MPLEFQWDVDGEGHRETIAHVGRRRVPRWVLRLGRWLLIGVSVLAALAYGVLRLRYEAARYQAKGAIQTVMDAEAQTFASADRARYLSYQDSAASEWLALQSLRASPDCADPPICPDPRFPGLCPVAHFSWDEPTDGRDALCAPVGTTQTRRLELRGERAWAIVSEGRPPRVRVRFYRRTGAGWRHTAPDPAFWREPVQVQRPGVVIRYHDRDQPHIAPLLEQILSTLSELDAVLRYWPIPGRLQIEFAVTTRAFQAPYVEHRTGTPHTRLVLSSPWLSGIPVDGEWATSELQRLRYWVAYAALSARAGEDLRGQGPSLLQQALLSEYGAWYLRHDPSLAPILSRVLARHGREALPRVFLSLRGGRLLGLFLARWLSVHPSQPAMFETLLAIEQGALRAGQKETFLLSQDERWLPEREAFYEAVRREVSGLVPPPRAQSVAIVDEYARVRLATMPPPPLDGPTQVEDGYVYFRQHNWEWKRTSTAIAALWRPVASPTAAPR